jgi:hypothetical protein
LTGEVATIRATAPRVSWALLGVVMTFGRCREREVGEERPKAFRFNGGAEPLYLSFHAHRGRFQDHASAAPAMGPDANARASAWAAATASGGVDDHGRFTAANLASEIRLRRLDPPGIWSAVTPDEASSSATGTN